MPATIPAHPYASPVYVHHGAHPVRPTRIEILVPLPEPDAPAATSSSRGTAAPTSYSARHASDPDRGYLDAAKELGPDLGHTGRPTVRTRAVNRGDYDDGSGTRLPAAARLTKVKRSK